MNEVRQYLRQFLNREGHGGNAVLEISISEDPTRSSSPDIVFRLSDCSECVPLDFSLWDEDEIDNSLHKARLIEKAVVGRWQALTAAAEDHRAALAKEKANKK